MRSCIVIGCAVLAAVFSTVQAQQTTSGVLPSSQGWYLPTGDQAGELFVFEIGANAPEVKPVVVLHGGPGADFSYMLPIANGLETAFHFVFYDQRGSLRSRVIADSISMARHVDDLETLREALSAQRINIVSHSAGTLLAFEYLRAYPDRVRNLVLVGALPHKNGRKYFDSEYAALWSSLAEDSRQFKQRDAILIELKKAGLETPQTPKQKALAALIRQVGAETFHVERWRQALPVRVNPEAARRTRESTNFEYDYSVLLANHRFQVTVINGEFDYTVGPRGSPLWGRLVETQAPRLRLVIVPNASHIVWRDAPDTFRRALSPALSR
jgi:pimeloyl-ACP methyl ester carboxylesterase